MSAKQYAVTIPDLSGKRALVTGASDGVGLGIATELAGAGAEVVMPVRNRRKGEAAATKIRERHTAARLLLETVELSSLSSIAALGEKLRVEGAPIHVLINNAGVMTPPQRQTTADGFELELSRRSQAGGWAITSNISHPGVAPTNLLSAQPEGRPRGGHPAGADDSLAAHPRTDRGNRRHREASGADGGDHAKGERRWLLRAAMARQRRWTPGRAKAVDATA